MPRRPTLQGTTLLNLQYRDGSRLRDQNEDTKQKAQYLYTATQHLTQHRDRNASDNSMNTTPADLQITAETEVLQGQRWVKVHSRYRCQWISDLRTRNMEKSFCGVPSKHTQDWAVNNHMLQTGLSFAENFCNKTPIKFSKICENRSSEVKETINFTPHPAGGLTAPPPPPPPPPPDPQLDFW